MGETRDKDYRTGVLCVLACQLIWGFLPIYWQALVPIPSRIIILYRIVTMFLYSYIAARFRYSREEIWAPLRRREVRLKYFSAGLLLTMNWSIYIWAMTTGHMIQSSIGYYIEPIVICTFGVVIFKEKLTKYNVVAMLMATLAMLVMLVHYGQLPGVALGLAFTWACYSAIKKTAEQPPLIALVYETVVYAVFAAAGILLVESRGIGALSLGVPGKYALMMFSGLVTLIPVALFASAARKVSLFMIGITQYLSPTITLLLGIFAYNEPIDKIQIISFIMIWTGLFIFSYGEFRQSKESIPK